MGNIFKIPNCEICGKMATYYYKQKSSLWFYCEKHNVLSQKGKEYNFITGTID